MENKLVQLIGDYFGISVPEGDTIDHPAIIGNQFGDNWADEEFMPYEDLPVGNWEFCFLSSTITEEDAKGVVGNEPFINYEPQNILNDTSCLWCETGKESFATLLKSKGLTGNIAILKKL